MFFSALVLGHTDETPTASDSHRREGEQLHETVDRIFQRKCVGCHTDMASPVFGADGMPKPQYMDAVKKRIQKESSDPMPPSDTDEIEKLTNLERNQITLFLNSKIAAGTGKVKCSDPSQTLGDETKAVDVIKKNCLGCHGAFDEPAYGDMPWTMIGKMGQGAMRAMHTPLFTTTGKPDATTLGVPEAGKVPPTGRSSLNRIMDQIAGHYMPPRSIAAPLSDEDRKTVLAYLGALKGRELCALDDKSRTPTAKNGKPKKFLFYEAATECQRESTSFLPTYEQVEEYVKTGGTKGKSDCYWTSSFSAEKETPRLIVQMVDGEPKRYQASEKAQCSVLCGSFGK